MTTDELMTLVEGYANARDLASSAASAGIRQANRDHAQTLRGRIRDEVTRLADALYAVESLVERHEALAREHEDHGYDVVTTDDVRRALKGEAS